MLQHFVANWLRQHAQEAIVRGFQTDETANSHPKSGDAAEPDPKVDIALFFPSASQAAGLTDLLRGVSKTQCNGFVENVGEVAGRRVAVIESSLPHEQLALVVRDVVTLRKPVWVISSGFAAAEHDSAKLGQLLVANRLVASGEYSLLIDAKMEESRGLRVGTLLTELEANQAETALSRPQSECQPLARDSQAAVIGEVCRVLKTKMLAIHCITRAQANPVAEKIKSQESIAGIVGAAAGALLDQPGSVKQMWNDKESTLVFSDRLAKFLVGLLPQLP